MDLYVFDRNLNFKGLLESYYSLRWIRRYHKSGEFELHCGLTPDSLVLLQRDNVIWKKDDLEAGYIEYRNIRQDQEGKEILVIKGKFLTGYFNRRIIWGLENFNTAAESAMRALINKNCINPVDINRKIPLLILGEVKEYAQTVNFQTSYANVLEQLENLSNVSELGYRTLIDINDKKLIFDIYKGKDLTVNQSVNPPAIFSKEFENVLEQEYTDSLNNYRSLVLVAGEGEGIARELVTVGEGIGLDRYELFVDARDLQSTDENDNIIPISEYKKMLEERGRTKLAEYTEIKTFDSRINLNSNLIYKKDFDLGDIVTCTSKRWGVTVDARITEVEEIYEQDGLNLSVIFGNNIPTLVDKIKQVVR
ncbi:siphovirus ReqiPepy6 Gp37-like family protein [Tissierella sp.]|uniref:siphovirus ReqiPepy6 Gp37-like family protein n=1 Tax=Tissierella sp. TaxID=41274 RepID=UPI00304D9EEB